MYYLVKSNQEIIDLISSPIPDFLLGGQYTLERIEDTALLTLPIELYHKATRPEYIKITSLSTFDVIGGNYPNNKVYTVSTLWNSATCVVTITAYKAAHKVVSSATNLVDINSVSIIDVPSELDTSESIAKSIFIDGVEYLVEFVAGVASFEYDYSGKEEKTAIGVAIDLRNYCLPLNVPKNIKALIRLKSERDIKLRACDWLISRHLSQPDNAKTLSPEQYAELQAYMQALRDLPASADLNNITWPAKPSFI